MTKNRTPINRRSRFSPEAINAFRLMQLLPEGSEQWCAYHDLIFFELGKPWLFPVVQSPDATKPHPEAVANFRELQAAVKAMY
jgi:hypothetical protein